MEFNVHEAKTQFSKLLDLARKENSWAALGDPVERIGRLVTADTFIRANAEVQTLW